MLIDFDNKSLSWSLQILIMIITVIDHVITKIDQTDVPCFPIQMREIQ